VRDFYATRPDGILGNDDCGQMSAWLVFAMLGFYPLQPSSGQYVAGAPLVRSASLRMTGGRMLTIRRGAPGVATLDGRPIVRTALRHADLASGGALVLGEPR
jgi:putative alpha-1,2-mannosidase